MSDEMIFLIHKDPKAFMDIVFTDDQNVRLKKLHSSLDDIALCEIIRYGAFNNSDMIGPLAELYKNAVLPNLSEPRRWSLYREVSKIIDAVEFVSVNALLPFIAEEESKRIVSSAVIDYVSLRPLTENDEMSGPRDIIGMLKSGFLKNSGAAFGALLHLGDQRVCKLLWSLRDDLSEDEIRTAVTCTTGFLYASSVEFEIDWMEAMDGDIKDGIFGLVASGLALQFKNNKFDMVLTGLRKFPAKKNPTEAEKEHIRDIAKPVSVSEYTKRIAPRLYALERTEPPPRVMPQVLSVWGLQPVTDTKEAADFDDRVASVGYSQSSQIPADADRFQIRSDDWKDSSGRIFATWGILNPNGPTLYTFGERFENKIHEIFLRTHHMLGGNTISIRLQDSSELTYDTIRDSLLEILVFIKRNEYPSPFGTVPSFIYANHNERAFMQMMHGVVANETQDLDWGRELYFTREFGKNFFGRAGCELRAAYEINLRRPDLSEEQKEFMEFNHHTYSQVPDYRDAKMPDFASSNFTDKLYQDWLTVIDDPERSRYAIGILFQMWDGALSILSDSMKENSVSSRDLKQFLGMYHLSFPEA
jgi:hypothetical protein